MLSRRAILLSLIVVVIFVRSSNTASIFNTLFSPSQVVSSACTAFGNMCIPFTSPKPKEAGNDADFEMLMRSSDKPVVVVTFQKDTESEGLQSFDNSFLQSLLKKHSDAEVIKVDVDKCPKTATNYRVPKTNERAYFNVRFKFKTADDFMNHNLLEIIPELINNSDPKHIESIKSQIEQIINSILIADLFEGRLDENLPQNVQEIVKTILPVDHEQKEEKNVEEDASKKPHTIVREVQILEKIKGKVLHGPFSAGREQEGTTEKAIQLVETGSDKEVNEALSNAKKELIILFFTVNPLRSDDNGIKTFLSGLSATKSNLKIIQVNVFTRKCGRTIMKYSISRFPTVLFLKYDTWQDVEIHSYDRKALEAEIINLLAKKIIVKSDGELTEALSKAAHELIIMNFTDNSLDENDCDIKMYLSTVSKAMPRVKVIQVNTNTGECQKSIDDYGIVSLPSVLFVKRGKTQAARVSSYDEAALEAEITNLLTRSKVVDSDKELTRALSYQNNELIVMFVTDNSLDENDCDMKKYLNGVSLSSQDIKIIQVNANTNQCENIIKQYAIKSYPTLIFLKRGKRQSWLTGFRRNAIIEELLNLVSTTEIVNSESELQAALSKADTELIILNITDNSLNDDDSEVKEFFSMFSTVDSNIKIVQVNVNNGDFRPVLARYDVTTYPTVLFIKRGKMQRSLVTGYNPDALKAEISTLISNSILVDTDDEINNLPLEKYELSIVFFTDNSLDKCDCDMKNYLSSLSISEQRITVIQVNTNTESCSKAIIAYNVIMRPVVFFLKHGKNQNTRVTGFDLNAINAEKNLLLSPSLVSANTELQAYDALKNFKNELIILFFTYNMLDKCDYDMKKLLGSLPINDEIFKIIRINANTEQCPMTLSLYDISSYPTLVLLKYNNKYNKQEMTKVTNCADVKLVKTEINKFLPQPVLVDSDVILTIVLRTAIYELIIVNITDNSFNDADFYVKNFLSSPWINRKGIKVIQVNANTNECSQTLSTYNITSYPSLIFMKNGKITARITGFNRRGIQIEINNLLSRILVVDSDEELDGALQAEKTGLVVVFVTDNSVNDVDCDMKEFLYTISTGLPKVKIIQVNANTGLCKKTIQDNNITFYPSLLFFKHGIKQGDTMADFDETAINASIIINTLPENIHSTPAVPVKITQQKIPPGKINIQRIVNLK